MLGTQIHQMKEPNSSLKKDGRINPLGHESFEKKSNILSTMHPSEAFYLLQEEFGFIQGSGDDKLYVPTLEQSSGRLLDLLSLMVLTIRNLKERNNEKKINLPPTEWKSFQKRQSFYGREMNSMTLVDIDRLFLFVLYFRKAEYALKSLSIILFLLYPSFVFYV